MRRDPPRKTLGGEQRRNANENVKDHNPERRRACTVGSQRDLRTDQSDCRDPVRIHRAEHDVAAGEYTLSAPSKSHDVMSIENVETRKTILVLAPSNVSEYKGAKDR